MAAVRRRLSIRRELHILILTVSVPMALIILGLLVMLLSVNSTYRGVLQNADIAAGFNQQFKDTIDQKMYTHVIQPRTGHDADDLPMEELDDAVSVLKRLEETTTLADNRWRIHSMLNMCENLRSYMLEIAACARYDDRMELLERNIRGETGLTILIESYMNDYINDEVRELSRLQSAVSMRVRTVIGATAGCVVILIAVMMVFSVRTSKRISEPMARLVEKVQRFGDGEPVPEPVLTGITEIGTLDRGFDDMAAHINALMARQIENERSLHRAELELLQAQINPHFLYNTLDSIAILAEMGRNDDVVSMVTSLSVFFRNSLSKGRDIISLSAESEQVRSYLEIQQTRYSDILTYELSIPEELMDESVPKLILQPLVENALYHGIKNRRGMGLIRVSGQDEGEYFTLTVTDNGAGMDEARLKEVTSGISGASPAGLGLANVQKRVRLYCGSECGLSFESEPGRGTAVTVRLKKKLKTGEET